MAAPSCETCKHYRPDIGWHTLWGYHRRAANENARCGLPQLPTMRYSLAERGNILLMNRSGELLYAELVRRMQQLCAPEGDFWEPIDKKSRLTRAKELFRNVISRFRRKAKSV